jgi:cell division septation protein DedD
LIVNSRYHNDTDLDELHEPADREISLGTSTILAIFFALALLCAIFFAFGYSLGRRSVPSAPAAPEAASSLTSNAPKPSPGSPSAASKPETADATAPASAEPDTEPAPSSPTAPTAPTAPTSKTVALTPVTSTTEPSARPSAKAAALTTRPSPAPAIAPPAAPATAGSALVQVAAVSHPEDADVLLSALKKRGYSVSIRHEPQDKLLHVQIGPFASKKDAEAMRQKLLADGYNAIVK